MLTGLSSSQMGQSSTWKTWFYQEPAGFTHLAFLIANVGLLNGKKFLCRLLHEYLKTMVLLLLFRNPIPSPPHPQLHAVVSESSSVRAIWRPGSVRDRLSRVEVLEHTFLFAICVGQPYLATSYMFSVFKFTCNLLSRSSRGVTQEERAKFSLRSNCTKDLDIGEDLPGRKISCDRVKLLLVGIACDLENIRI